MISKVLISVGIMFSMIGTILTLWTTFSTSIKSAGTWSELANRHAKFPKEKRRVIIGTIVILIGGLLQIIGTFI